MPRTKKINIFDEAQVYGRAEELLGDNSNSLQAMALYAFEQRKSREAMRVLSFVWMRNARMLARAVCRWPIWYMDVDGETARPGSTDEYLAMFYMASLPLDESLALYEKWRRYTWSAWQVREKIEEIRAARGEVRRARLKSVKVKESGPNSLILNFDRSQQKEWEPGSWEGADGLEVTLAKKGSVE